MHTHLDLDKDTAAASRVMPITAAGSKMAWVAAAARSSLPRPNNREERPCWNKSSCVMAKGEPSVNDVILKSDVTHNSGSDVRPSSVTGLKMLLMILIVWQ